MKGPRRSICFDEPDEAYLAAAALRRYLDGSMDAILIPTDRGPAMDIARDALRNPLVWALIKRFGGRLDEDDEAVFTPSRHHRLANESGEMAGEGQTSRPPRPSH